MKRILTLLIPLLLLFSVASAENWQKFAQDPQGRIYFIDIDHLELIKENIYHKDSEIAEQTLNNPKRVWIKLTLKEPDKANKNLLYQKFLLEFDTTKKTQRIIYVASYDDQDTLLVDKILPSEPWQPIPEGNHLLNIVNQVMENYLNKK